MYKMTTSRGGGDRRKSPPAAGGRRLAIGVVFFKAEKSEGAERREVGLPRSAIATTPAPIRASLQRRGRCIAREGEVPGRTGMGVK